MENSQLKSEVTAWKVKLTVAEVENGKKVYCALTNDNVEKPKDIKVEDVPAPEAEKKEKNVKADKPAPKEKKEVKKEDEFPVEIGRQDLHVGHISSGTGCICPRRPPWPSTRSRTRTAATCL